MATGTVKTVTGKGFGFISQEDSDKDIFYHENSLEGELAERKLKVGDKVLINACFLGDINCTSFLPDFEIIFVGIDIKIVIVI